MSNLQGIHLQRDLYEAIFMIKQMHKFNTLEFIISKAFLPMNLYKVFDFWSGLKVLIISCDKSKITIDRLKKIMQIKIFNSSRELAEMIEPILGEDMCENYQKIVICDFPFTKEEIKGFQDIKNIIIMKVNLDVDFKIKSYSPVDLFKFFQSQNNLNTLYFRCLPYPASSRLSDADFNSICSSIIKIKSLNHLYLDMNFSNTQITRVNRIEFKINHKKIFVQILDLFKKKYPSLHQLRWEIKFELFNMFLTEKMRELKPTLEISDKNKKNNPIYSEYFCKF